jgi:hypothetical protein
MNKIKAFYAQENNKTFNEYYYVEWLVDLFNGGCGECENINDIWWDRCKKIKGKKIRYWNSIPDEYDMYL